MTKEELLERLNNSTTPLLVELGCGRHKLPNAIGIDKCALDGVDIIADLEEGLSYFPDGSVDTVYSRHVLEHIDNLEPLMREIYRVLKVNGKHMAIVPHFSNPYYYSDYTHKHYFGLYTFDYFCEPQSTMRYKVPEFYTDYKFTLIERKLIFKSLYPVRSRIKRYIQKLFNASPYLQEFYEECLCHLIPCHEVEFVMLRKK
jgi:ubiquinone/menaquinone biosynthesis C-methylase UbiE